MKTTIVIPNYNGAQFLEKCMHALLSQSRQDFSILFVDNASKDDSEKQIRHWMEQDPERIFLIQNTENTGFATAVNQGILWAKGQGASYALLLNNDTEVAPDFVEQLLLFMEEKEKKGEKVFALSSKMVKMHDPSLMDDAGHELCLLGFPFQRGLEDEASRWTKAEKVFSACGGASLYSIPLLEETGLFDEKHFSYPFELSGRDIPSTTAPLPFVSMWVPEPAGENTVILRWSFLPEILSSCFIKTFHSG